MKPRLLLALALLVCAPGASPRAQSRQAEEEWPRVTRLSDRVIVLTLDGWQRDNTVIVASKRGLVLVDADTSQSYGRQIRDIARRELGRDDFVYVVNTHDDWDHTGGNQAFAGATIIGQRQCYEMLKRQRQHQAEEVAKEQAWASAETVKAREALAKAAHGSDAAGEAANTLARLRRYADDLSNNFQITPPNLVYEDRLLLDLGDLTVRLLYFGRAHKEGDTLVLVPEEHLLMTGDLAFDSAIAAQVEGGRYQGAFDVPRWLEALHEVLDGGTTLVHVVKGHASIESGEWLAVRRRYLSRLWEGVQAARARGATVDQAVKELSLQAAFPDMIQWDPKVAASELARRHAALIRLFWERGITGGLPLAVPAGLPSADRHRP